MFKHILVPLDGSHLAQEALPAALELARRFDSEITLLRVTRTPYVPSDVGGKAYADLIVSLREQVQYEAQQYLKALYGSLRSEGYKVHMQILDGEPIAELILGVVEAQGIDTIVMSTHGRGGLSRWVYGSVADKVLRHAQVPVLLVRSTEHMAKWTTEEARIEGTNPEAEMQ